MQDTKDFAKTALRSLEGTRGWQLLKNEASRRIQEAIHTLVTIDITKEENRAKMLVAQHEIKLLEDIFGDGEGVFSRSPGWIQDLIANMDNTNG